MKFSRLLLSLFLIATPAFAAPTYITGTAGPNSNALFIANSLACTTSCTATTTAALQTNDVVSIVMITNNGSDSFNGCSINDGGSPISGTGTTNGGIANGKGGWCNIVMTRGMASGATVTMTTDLGTPSISGFGIAVRGSSGFDATGSKLVANGAANTTMTAVTNARSQVNSFMFACMGVTTVGTLSADAITGATLSTSTTLLGTEQHTRCSYAIVDPASTTAALTYTVTNTSSSTFGGIMTVLSPAATAGASQALPLLGASGN